ncbi:MAG: DUF2092 domain-containing protein [Proteobacteria bacterium]|nr:DUF2092 domain-containing protein [Pseudomonadota bacterium]
MKRIIPAVFLLMIIIPLFCGIGSAQSKAAGPAIDPQAEKILQALNAQKKKDIKAGAEVIDTMDEVLKSGEKIQYSHMRKLKISEPQQFWIESTGDITNTTVWKDDKTFTLLDRSNNVYGQVAAPGTIDETMDMMVEKYGVTTPLADLLSDNVYSILMKNVKTCRYLGIHYAEGMKCHHIAATQNNIDWQIWVDAGDVPQLRKIVITYKQQPGAPQYTAVLKSFNEVPQFPDGTFTFKAPEGARKISLLPIKKRVKKASEKE